MWSTWREGVRVVVAPRQLRRTVSVALIVGSAFFAMNQLGVIVAGHAQVGIEIPPDYARDLQLNRKANVLVLIDGSDSTVASSALSAAICGEPSARFAAASSSNHKDPKPS